MDGILYQHFRVFETLERMWLIEKQQCVGAQELWTSISCMMFLMVKVIDTSGSRELCSNNKARHKYVLGCTKLT